MRTVIVMGKGELAVRIANWFHSHPDYRLTTIVPVIPEPTWAPSIMAWKRQLSDVTAIETGDYKDLPGVLEESWKVDLVFSIFYDRILKDWFIKKCRKILNIHNGPLPRYRGVSPINWALKNAEIEHGVTIHEITPGIDDGPVVAQLKYSIYPAFDEVIDVYKRAIEYGWVLFQQTMPIVEKIQSRVQDESQASYYNAKQNSFLLERRYFTKQESIDRLGRSDNKKAT